MKENEKEKIKSKRRITLYSWRCSQSSKSVLVTAFRKISQNITKLNLVKSLPSKY
jgi:hypothetical protein